MPLLLLFVVTAFISAALLFLVQPMFARMVLPLLGGSPAVWNTCMVFFQAALLGGYVYAHLVSRWFSTSWQGLVHLALLVLPWLTLPIGMGVLGDNWEPPTDTNPLPWLLMILSAGVGLPFFVVASSAPLLQHWFSRARHVRSDDPYFLYAASNAGSMIALLSYPLIVEPAFGLAAQSRLWTAGYAFLTAMMVTCAVAAIYGSRRKGSTCKTAAELPETVKGDRLPMLRLVRWIALAFVPSSLMLGVTMHITTDLVVVPLLWVLPLAIYLLSFILVFARRQWLPHSVMVRAMPITVVVLLLILLSHATQPLALLITAHLAGLFIISMTCHGELSRDRPHAQNLTTFYLMLGVGGMLGGVFNAIAAPLLFSSIIEYPAAIVAACLIAPSAAHLKKNSFWRPLDVLLAAAVFMVGLGAIALSDQLGLEASPVRLALTVGLPVVLVFLLSRDPLRFGLAVAAVFLAGSFETVHRGDVRMRERSFFGVHLVTRAFGPSDSDSAEAVYHRLYHGTTLHGSQRIDRETASPIDAVQPLDYYHRSGPLGLLFASFAPAGGFKSVGLVGLGAGASAAYAEHGDSYMFYEIDPLVSRIAQDERWFTYISGARERGAEIAVILGDARLTLAREPEGSFDLLILDAFSSDAIPVHLLTREAVAMYQSKLAEGGLLAFHISSRYFNLKPLLAAIAHEVGLRCFVLDDSDAQPDGERKGSIWAVLAADDAALGALRNGPQGWLWKPAQREDRVRPWTDDYSNILSVLIIEGSE